MSIGLFALFLFGLSASQELCGPETAPLGRLQALSTFPASFAPQGHSLMPGPVWGSLRPPFPTNSFFTNVGLNASYFPIAPYPYHLKLEDSGIVVSYAEWKSVTRSYITTPFIGNLVLSSEQPCTMKIQAYDEMSVTLRWEEKAGGSGTVISPIVRGSPFVTAIYSHMTPVFRSSHAILTVNGNGGSGPFTGSEFSIRMNNGQNWMIFSIGGPITLVKRNNQLASVNLFTGVIRAAVAVREGDEISLRASAVTYPTGVSISYSFLDSVAHIQFRFITSGGCPESLLMMALPHHIDSAILSTQMRIANVSYQTIKGTMTGIRGNVWTLREQLTSIKWSSPLGIPADKIDSIRAALMQEKGRRNNVGDPYTAGKILSSMARMALIADEMGEDVTARAIRENIKMDLDPWVLGTNWNCLRYETSWGGICSSLGISDPNADYGQGWYNDHHFHYGYLVYAAAVVGKSDRAWLASRREKLLEIVRDFANPSNGDPYFPVTRNKDWFDGHSWASGLFPFGDSKNQESTSESVNAYYAVYLLGESLGDIDLSNWGRLLMATEIRSVHKYWQITESSEIYPSPFSEGKVVGVLWSTKVDYATFFGGNVEYIHCIQMMPFTPITEELLPASWVQEEYPVLSQSLNRTIDPIGEGWKGYVFMDHAVIDRDSAWNEALGLRWYDNGNSKTNTLYWIATRPPPLHRRFSFN